MACSNNPKLSEGDDVIVVGDSFGSAGHTDRKMIIAEVMAVGIEEIFLKCHKTDITFKRPINNCYKIPKIELRNKITPAQIPALGDLVLSYSGGRYTKQKKVVGILMEIVDNPPGDLDAKILSGKETHTVPFRSLILVESK